MTTRRWLALTGAVMTAAVAVACLWYVAPLAVGLIAGGLAAAALVVLGLSQVAVERQRRASHPVLVHGVTVHVRAGAGACTAGPIIPRVFLGADLLLLLTADELRAVVLHEDAHRTRLDPLRAATALLMRVGSEGRLSERCEGLEARREIRADRVAVARGASRSAIAAALLKVPALGTAGVGFAPASELRVRALLGHDVEIATRRPLAPAIAASAFVGALLCIETSHALAASLMAVCCS